jgi:hypothetical protein
MLSGLVPPQKMIGTLLSYLAADGITAQRFLIITGVNTLSQIWQHEALRRTMRCADNHVGARMNYLSFELVVFQEMFPKKA